MHDRNHPRKYTIIKSTFYTKIMFVNKRKKNHNFCSKYHIKFPNTLFYLLSKKSKNWTVIYYLIISVEPLAFFFCVALLQLCKSVPWFSSVRVHRLPAGVSSHGIFGHWKQQTLGILNTGLMLPFIVDKSHTMCCLILAVIMKVQEVQVRSTLFLPDLLGSSHQFCHCQRRLLAQLQSWNQAQMFGSHNLWRLWQGDNRHHCVMVLLWTKTDIGK